jgi:glycosyltransferase involved in cell wall biosynthesis
MTEGTKPSICFVAFGASHFLTERNVEIVGGSELQSSIVAKELAAKAYDISFVVFDHGQQSLEVIDGIKIYKSCSFDDFAKKRPLKMMRIFTALGRANSDLYYLRGGHAFVSALAAYCLLRGRKLCYSMASELDIKIYKSKNPLVLLFRLALRSADLVIAQSQSQKQILLEHFHRKSVIIRNICNLSDECSIKDVPPTVLWVSTIKKDLKRPDIFLRLAQEIPEAKFIMIGGATSGEIDYFNTLKKMAADLPNFELKGFVPHNETNLYYGRAALFVNTSPTEGFPNTFLEAWAASIPVVSLNTDPDEIIRRNNLGFHSRTFEQMVEDVRTLLSNDKLRGEMGRNGRIYVETYHDKQRIIALYDRCFSQLLTNNACE